VLERVLNRPMWALLGVAGPVFALACMAYLTPAHAGVVSPLNDLVSDYALLDEGAWVLLAGTLSLAMSCLWLAYGLTLTEPGTAATTRALLVAGAFGLLLTALFPTDPTPDVTSMGGEIHRWSAAIVFTALPVAGWRLGRRLAVPAITRSALACAPLLALFLASHPGSVVAEIIGGPAYYGLVERALLVVEIVLVLLIGLTLLRTAPVTTSNAWSAASSTEHRAPTATHRSNAAAPSRSRTDSSASASRTASAP
jgi:hypothetical protein